MVNILAINGSYRTDGITDQIIDAFSGALQAEGAHIEVVTLRDCPIEFCLNCRECTQHPGSAPGQCVHHDGMQALLDKIEAADAYILASPTNFGSVTAIYKRFMERLIVYAYWPWGEHTPKYRKAEETQKKAILVSSCGAPSILGRWIYGTRRQLKISAKTIGAIVVGTVFSGLISDQRHQELPAGVKKKIAMQAKRLLAAC